MFWISVFVLTDARVCLYWKYDGLCNCHFVLGCGMYRVWGSDSSAAVHRCSSANHGAGNRVTPVDEDGGRRLGVWATNVELSEPFWRRHRTQPDSPWTHVQAGLWKRPSDRGTISLSYRNSVVSMYWDSLNDYLGHFCVLETLAHYWLFALDALCMNLPTYLLAYTLAIYVSVCGNIARTMFVHAVSRYLSVCCAIKCSVWYGIYWNDVCIAPPPTSTRGFKLLACLSVSMSVLACFCLPLSLMIEWDILMKLATVKH